MVLYRTEYTLTLTLGKMAYKLLPRAPLHYVTYAPAKLEVATSKGLEGDALHENSLFKLGVKVK